MDNQKKNDITYKRKEKNDSIESEEETIDLNFLQEQNIKKKKEESLLQKKRHSRENIEKKNSPYLKGEFNKFKDKGNYIKTEKKININAEISIEYQNLNKKFQNMKREFVLFQHQLELTNRKIKELQEQNLKLNSKLEEQNFKFNSQLEEQNFKFNSQLEEQRITQQILKKENDRLQQSFKENVILENILLRKVDLLKVQVDELSQFHFKAKLRKLLKNLIEYLFQQFYPKYIYFNKETNKINFLYFPLYKYKKIAFMGVDKIKAILNDLLDKIFVGAKSNDYVVHFVEQRAENTPYYRRNIIVFKNADEFFQYFNIYGIDKDILLHIIPPNYFMEFDNFKFEKSIRNLILYYS